MGSETRKIPVSRFSGSKREKTEDDVVKEYHLTVTLNDRDIITLPCLPLDLDSLAVGYLVSEGYIRDKSEIRNILMDEEKGSIRIEVDNAGVVTSKLPAININSDCKISTDEVYGLMDKFVRHSEVFEATGGVHSAALCDRRDIIIFKDDIGRNNAVDKMFGECILKGISLEERVVMLSCRISSEILYKIVRRKIPVIISKSPPTDYGVELAAEMGITLLGFVRGKRMNAYAHDWRII